MASLITIHDQADKQFYASGGSDVVSDLDTNFVAINTEVTTHIADEDVHLTSAQNTWIDAITATSAEVNLLDLSGLTAGWVLKATGAATAAWGALVEADITDLDKYTQAEVDTLLAARDELSELTDVAITDIASGEILKWSGSAWINNTLAEAGISVTGHVHAAGDITSGTFADALIAESNVTQHVGAINHNSLLNTHQDVQTTASPSFVDATMDGITFSSLRDISDYTESPMIVTGGLLSQGTNAGTFKVVAITSALLRTTDSITGELTEVTLAEEDNQVITLADTKYHVILTYGSPCTISISTIKPNNNTAIRIGTVMKNGSDVVHYCNCGMRLNSGVAKLHQRAGSLREMELANGCTIAYQAVREFTMTSGVAYVGINRLEPFSGGYDSGTDKFTYCYRDTDVWQYTTDSTVIDDDYYDNNTAGKGSIGAGRYGCHWVYIHPGDEDVYVVYGRDSYKLAEAEVAQPPGDLPIILGDFAMLVGKIIIQKDATSFAEVQMVIDYFFTGTAVADHGELAGLTDDDHSQYHNDSRALTWLGTRSLDDLPDGSTYVRSENNLTDTLKTNYDTAYSHSQITGGIHEDWTSSVANFSTSGTLGCGAITATSYGGITEANLLDKSATESISGAWTFGTTITIKRDNINYFDSYAYKSINPLLGIRNYGARGTEAAKTIVANNDIIFHATGYGYDGTDYHPLAEIVFFVDGTPSDGTDMPGRIVFSTTPDGSATLTEALRLDSSQQIHFKNYNFPVADGTASQVLQTNGSGVLTWQTPAGGGDCLKAADETITGAWDFENTLTIKVGTQDWLFKDGNVTGRLQLQGQTSGISTIFQFGSKDSDTTDSVLFNIFGKGAGDSANYERLNLGYVTGATPYLMIGSEAGGSGVVRDLVFKIGGNEALRIDSSQNATFGGDVTIDAGTLSRLTLTGSGPGYIDAGIVLKATNASANTRGLGMFMHDDAGGNEWFIGRGYGSNDCISINRKVTATHDEEITTATNRLYRFNSDGSLELSNGAKIVPV